MKAFEKWWKTYHQEWGLNEHYAKEGWRAALEWAISNKRIIFEGGYNWDDDKEVEIIDVICLNRELED